MKLLYSLVIVILGCCAVSVVTKVLKEGSRVNDIQLTDIKGSPILLYEYLEEGYTVLIDFSATWCVPLGRLRNIISIRG